MRNRKLLTAASELLNFLVMFTSISLDLVIFQGPWSFSTDAAEGAMKSDISGRLKSHLPTQRQRTPICN
ncbi:hypothetical protein PC128_g16374 [Phytophthora cactorum]|uniref:Uncharacterized protein n=1 Tax=Phytophthora cactorum TaxID=29920 RepID=A0A8T1CAJ1_9STRA|nr:hypothetical protein PC117_g17390 [Phytophthora cactorum]KAG3013131.1 hypothetical protein PC120_g13440 [Phytophthora cactorum]KAG3178562.1 hypothetical protein PC128_g16374 [Phytophthora cactorum]